MTAKSESKDAIIGADDNRRLFDQIVPRYDMLNRLMSMGLDKYWRKMAVRALAPEADGRYLDIGCGTGDLCIESLRRSPGSMMFGIDQSTVMLECAREKVRRLQLEEGANFEEGNACQLRYNDVMFDGIISGFCIRNVTDRRAAFAEMLRVTRPSANISLLELTLPSSRLVRVLHRIYNHCVVRLLGAILSNGDAYRYLVESIQAFPDPLVIADEMRKAGMVEVVVRPMSLGAVTLFTAQKPAERADGMKNER